MRANCALVKGLEVLDRLAATLGVPLAELFKKLRSGAPGPRILRADTAAVTALTLVQAAIGDWLAGRTAVMVETLAYGPSSAIRYTIRIGDNDWPVLQKLCNTLIMAGGACVVLPNRSDKEAAR